MRPIRKTTSVTFGPKIRWVPSGSYVDGLWTTDVDNRPGRLTADAWRGRLTA